jgi:hypothetical protein
MIMHIVASPVRPKRGANLESPKSFFMQLPALATCSELPRQTGEIFPRLPAYENEHSINANYNCTRLLWAFAKHASGKSAS